MVTTKIYTAVSLYKKSKTPYKKKMSKRIREREKNGKKTRRYFPLS